MKKNISLALSLLLLLTPLALLSMENGNAKNDKKCLMEESVIVIPEPKKRGFGFVRSSYDLLWNEEENLYNDLLNKKFDAENSSYHRKLDTAIEIFVEKENSDKLAQTFALCQTNYPKQIKIGDSQAVMAHKLLIKENKARQTLTKEEIQKIDKLYLEKENELLSEAKKVLAYTIASMQNVHDKHMLERNNLITDKCNEIRKIKTASIHLHKLNKTFQLPENEKDGYCSDDEKDIKTPQNLNNSYNDANILQKINIAHKIEETNAKINDLLVALVALESKLKTIQPLQY